MRKFLIAVFLFSMMTGAQAHDEGHGPKLTDPAKYGGMIAPVIFKSDVDKGRKAKMQFKAEVTKNSAGKMRIYLYDTSMKPVKNVEFEKLGGVVYFKDSKTGKSKDAKLSVTKKGEEISTQLPKEVKGRFDFDFTFGIKKEKYFVAFDGMR